MKHTVKITLMIVLLFFAAQVVGLGVTNKYIDHQITSETGNVTFAALPYGIERPPLEQSSSYIWIISAILIGTVLVLLLIHFRKNFLWKIWFLLAVIACLTIAFSAFVNQMAALAIAAAFGYWKIFRPNVIVHNLTEVFVYGGLAAIFVPIMNVFSVFMLLAAISVYDMIAVWKSKHMIKLAKFQAKSNIFAGLMIPYKSIGKKTKMIIPKIKGKLKAGEVKEIKAKSAVLGGGDIGFPLLFSGVIMKGLMLEQTVMVGFLKTLIITVCVSIALFFLLMLAKKDRFYPAMPFLSVGCAAGYIILLLI